MPILNLFLCAIKVSRGTKIKAQQSKRACCLRFADNKPFRILGLLVISFLQGECSRFLNS